ncbi:phosphoserine phosphatase SerB [Streptococcus pseudopneumoniae]|uniref:phosphoserine phosphatase SerB n=1 Tax=Streptococcus TaxID=1301 RepID=UPI00066DA49A|nr:phosphoserine phosphatase SerB [Streptococcus pseudopneumoniae]
MKKIKGLCVLDVDGTLIEEEVIDLLGKEAECENEVALLTAQAMRGELDFEESLRKRVSLLGGLSLDVFERLYSQIHLSKNAKQFIKFLQEQDIEVGLVSGGFIPIVERLATELGISLIAANRLEVKDGFLTGKLEGEIITREVKEETLVRWADELEVPLERTIAIGDGANDLAMLKRAGIGIGFCAKAIVKEEIPLQIEERDFSRVLKLIDLF